MWLELWTTRPNDERREWETVSGATSEIGCVNQRARKIDTELKSEQWKLEGDLLKTPTKNGYTLFARIVCLPDTVDPRGTK